VSPHVPECEQSEQGYDRQRGDEGRQTHGAKRRVVLLPGDGGDIGGQSPKEIRFRCRAKEQRSANEWGANECILIFD